MPKNTKSVNAGSRVSFFTVIHKGKEEATNSWKTLETKGDKKASETPQETKKKD